MDAPFCKKESKVSTTNLAKEDVQKDPKQQAMQSKIAACCSEIKRHSTRSRAGTSDVPSYEPNISSVIFKTPRNGKAHSSKGHPRTCQNSKTHMANQTYHVASSSAGRAYKTATPISSKGEERSEKDQEEKGKLGADPWRTHYLLHTETFSFLLSFSSDIQKLPFLLISETSWVMVYNL